MNCAVLSEVCKLSLPEWIKQQLICKQSDLMVKFIWLWFITGALFLHGASFYLVSEIEMLELNCKLYQDQVYLHMGHCEVSATFVSFHSHPSSSHIRLNTSNQKVKSYFHCTKKEFYKFNVFACLIFVF